MLAIHGSWKIKLVGNVIIQCFSDSWNEEAVLAYIKEFKTKVLPLIGHDWAMVSIFEHWQLGIPEIEQHVIEHCDWFKENGCVKDCHVYSPNFFKKLQLEKIIPTSEVGYERCVFEHLTDAIAWMNTQGFILAEADFLSILDKDNESIINI
jgi:hypothetical protein